ncbi:lamin tail domain-containing protein [Vulcaniibacterium gelatinicum]|uniref:lamin tail domain-containing protein n=1 Tax=Vulcaniibacterium gelatinicum TaxID=2598725 RepID=UPI0015F2B0BD|nr:lamin tail domain-containing protein [Vulcaniibacterium gelatinicum]
MKHGLARLLALGCMLAGACGLARAQVVISQVYGGGGNSGATWKSDFIELRNTGSAPVNLGGWSVQYASATGTSWQRTNLSGTIAPGGYYLVKQADGAGGTTPLPTPDASGTIAMSASAGKVALVAGTATLSGSCPLGGAVVDFVGFGGANCFEGTGPAPTLGNTTAALRKNAGAADSNDNAADFTAGTPTPRNSATAPPDAPLALSIARIQGAGPTSPYLDRRVVTEGIVTARRFNNGFFLQSANDDGDPATSEGIFVFTGSAPTVAVGSRVRVTAQVAEFTPASNPHQLPITQLTTPVVEVLETGLPLPAPVALTAADLAPAATPATLERLEGMRVQLSRARTVSGSGGSLDEDDALAFTDGVFHVVLPEVARPFREPGLSVLEATPIPAGKHPPRFDTNPERLMVRSRGQVGATALAVDAGAEVTGLTGVLDYASGTWALLPDPSAPVAVAGGRLPQAVNDPAYEEVTIAGFNLLRLFDEVADGNGAPTLKPAALDKRLAKAAAAICHWLKAPDILGVVEVENRRVLELLAARVDATCPRAPRYVPYLEPGNDRGGINVGFLVSARDNGAGVARVEVLEVAQYGKDATFANPDGSSDLLNDRPPLLLRARVHQDNGAHYDVTVIVNHLRSLNGIDDLGPGSNGWASESERVRAKRGAQAAYLAQLVDWRQARDPGERIVLVGDFNAFEFNDGYVDVMGIVRGEEAPAEQVLTYVDSPLRTPLVDGGAFVADPAERYSYVFGGNAQTLDHALVNEALVLDALTVRVEHARINADFGVHHFGDGTTPLRSSDHDPVRIAIAVPAFRSADLAATASAPAEVRVGARVPFQAQVRNAGPNAALHASVGFAFDAAVAPTVHAPEGWQCSAPATEAHATTCACTTPRLEPGASAAFTVEVPAGDALGGRSLRMAVAAASTITDPANADNLAEAQVQVRAEADLALALSGPTLPFRSGTTARFPLTLRNDGADAAWQPRVRLHGDAPPTAVAIAAPAGWACEVTAAGPGFAAECAHEAAFAAGRTQAFDFAITAPPRQGRDELVLEARADAATPDPDPADDTAALRTRIVGAPRDTPAPPRPAPTPGG